MKKFNCILALGMAAALTLSSCSSGGSGSSGSGNTTGAKGAPVELNYAFITTGSTPAGLSQVEDEINKITVPKINAKIKLTLLNFGQAQQQYNLMLSSGEKLDLFLAYPFSFSSLVSQHKIQDITAPLVKYGAGIKSALGPQYLTGIVNNKIYGVQPVREAAAPSMIIRKDIVDKYHINTNNVKSLDDLGKMFATIHSAMPNQEIMCSSSQGQGLEEMYSQFDCDRLSDGFGVLMNYGQSLKVTNLYESSEYSDFIKLMRQWYNAGYIMKDIATNKDDQHSLVKSGKALGYMTPYKPGVAQQESAQNGYVCDAVEFGKPFYVASTLWEYCVPTACTNPEKSVQFLNLMYTDPKITNLLAWGIEGTEYVKKSDGSIDFPSGVTEKNSKYYINEAWAAGNQFLTYVWKGDDLNIWKETKQYNDSCIASKANGFSYDPSNVKNELTALNNVYSTYKMSLESGTVDPTTALPEFIKKLKDAGIDTVIQEKQKQLDQWAKTNKVS